jgi:CheY-like chemotaxis protein
MSSTSALYPPGGSREGYGLGLSIVQRIVELLGARLDASSELGKGSSFSLTLPATQQRGLNPSDHTPLAEAPVVYREQRTKPRILVVEDDPGVRDATRMLLAAEGYRVVMAATLGEALRQVRTKEDVDVLVADYHLRDGETGIQVLEALRSKLGVALDAVLISGDTSATLKSLGDPNLKISSKPVKAEELLALLQEFEVPGPHRPGPD